MGFRTMPSLQAAIIDGCNQGGFVQGILLALEHDADQAKQPITIPAAEAYDLSEQPIRAGDMVMFSRGRQQIIEAAVTHYAYKVLKVVICSTTSLPHWGTSISFKAAFLSGSCSASILSLDSLASTSSHSTESMITFLTCMAWKTPQTMEKIERPIMIQWE